MRTCFWHSTTVLKLKEEANIIQHVIQQGYIDTIEKYWINVLRVSLDTKESFCAKPFWFINYAYIKHEWWLLYRFAWMEEYHIFAKNMVFAAAELFRYSYAYLQVDNVRAL